MDNQLEFDQKYISSTEICSKLGVTRSAIIAARSKGLLPPPIQVQGVKLSLWVRDEVQNVLDQWEAALNFRRGNVK